MSEIEDGRLRDCFTRVGSQIGYGSVNASYHPYKEFKTTWSRCGDNADFKVTDYLRGAPPGLMEEFATCLLSRLTVKSHREKYNENIRTYLRSEEFVSRNRPLYLARSRNLAFTMRGRHHDLRESYDRLLSSGLLPHIPNTYITWTARPNKQRLGYCSMLMRTIAISSGLDRAEIPSFVADYVLYHEMLHMQEGVTFAGRYHTDAFKAKERLYPRWQEAEDWLRRASLLA
ncbi:MAG: M48 family metallopeptidase [Methanomassiliicoccales archaeon]